MEEEGVGFLDEGGEDAEAIGEGLHRIAEEVEHLDLAAGEPACFHAVELREVEVAFVAELFPCHAYGPDGCDEKVVPHGLEDEDESSARLEHSEDLAAEAFGVVREVVQRGLPPHKIERFVVVGAEIEGIAGDKGESGKLLELIVNLRASGRVEVESDDLGLWKDLGQGDGELAKAAADLECASAREIYTAEFAVTRKEKRLVRSRESANRRKHRFRPRVEGRRWMGEVHGGGGEEGKRGKVES